MHNHQLIPLDRAGGICLTEMGITVTYVNFSVASSSQEFIFTATLICTKCAAQCLHEDTGQKGLNRQTASLHF